MKLHYVLFVLSIISYSNISAAIVGTLLERIQLAEFVFKLSPISFFRDVLDYTEGGITFTYDSGIFTEDPCVRISVELLDATFTVTDAYVATVTYNDAYSVGVVAHHINDIIEEAPTNSVKIHLEATGR